MWYKNESYPNKEKAVNALIESVVDGCIEDINDGVVENNNNKVIENNNRVKISDEKLYKYAKGCVDVRLWCKEYDNCNGTCTCSIIKDAVMKSTGCNEFDEALNKIGRDLGDICERCCMQCFLDWCYKKSYGRKPMNWEVKHGWIVGVKNGVNRNGTIGGVNKNECVKGKVIDRDNDNVKLVVFEDGVMLVLSQGLMDNVDKIWNCEKFSECRDECLVWC